MGKNKYEYDDKTDTMDFDPDELDASAVETDPEGDGPRG